MIGLLLGVVVAQADEFDLQPLGQPVQGEGWTCPEGRSLCTRPSRALSFPGIWTAQLDEAGAVASLTFSVFWIDGSVPHAAGQNASTVAGPWAAASSAFQRFEQAHRGWEVVSRTLGDPPTVIYERGGERRTIAAWSTALTNEGGETFVTAGLHVEREAKR